MKVVGLLMPSLYQGSDEARANGGTPCLKEGERPDPFTRS